MADEYCRSLLKVAVAQLCQGLGWHAVHTTPCDLLTDVLQRYLEHLARHSHRYAEQYGRTDPNLDDVGLTFSHMHVRLNELETYLKEVEPIPFAHPLPSFPIPKRNNLQIPQPGSRDCRERLEYIPEHMPPLGDIAGEYGEGLDSMDLSHSSRMSIDIDGYEPHTPLMSPNSPRGDKRELLSPASEFNYKRLRLIDDGTPRELTAISMGINGEITPKREGRLPVATTPPRKPLVERRSGLPQIPLSKQDTKMDGLLTKVPKSPRPSANIDLKSSKAKGITPPKPKPKSPKHLFFSPSGAPSVFQVKPKSPAVVIMDKVKELMPSGSKSLKVTGPNIGTLLITTKKSSETAPITPTHHSDDDKSPSPKKPSALDVYDFEDEDTKPRPSKTFDPCGEAPDPSKAVLPSARLIVDDEEEVVANEASINDTIESVISKMARSSDNKPGKKNGKEDRTKEKGKDKVKEKGKDKNNEKGKGGLLDMANKSTQEKSSSKGQSLPPKLLFKHAWRDSEGATTSATSLKLLIKTDKSDSKDKRESKEKKDKIKKNSDEKSVGKVSKKERSKRKKDQMKKDKLKKKKMDKKRKLQELSGKRPNSDGETEPDSQKQPAIAKLNIITKNPKSMKVRLVSQSESASSSPSRDKTDEKQQKDKMNQKKKRKDKERKAKVKAARESLKKAKKKDENTGVKRGKDDKSSSEEPPEKVAKLIVPKITLRMGAASSKGEATKIFIKKQSEMPKPPPARARTPSSSSSSSSSSSPSPSPRRKSPSPSPPPRSPSPPPRSPSPQSSSPSPPPKKTPAAKKASLSKKASQPKKTVVASPPPSPPAPRSPSPPPPSPPTPKIPVTAPPVRKAASKAFSAIAKPTKGVPAVSTVTSQPTTPIKGISVPTKASLKAPVEKPAMTKGAGKTATGQKSPGGAPAGVAGVTVGSSAQRTVILETVGTVVSDTGERIWICPNCKLPDDGSAMVGCDTCDDWYHWPCVGIKEEPTESNWYCPRCRVPSKKKGKKKHK
ncbi:transcription initiation factor TFIID subunit 3-like [Asterias rubens]|uniref:transcription initiation factor TFIID subunit 3-like n=1 Tax=Asterias rubens TaxID=7604 RepID=UPI0014553324|nr:transcription initiation factor TFIID subunit 3-like [Asterias rubens]XP_033647961.1 transcription initiation factor TFIID subunit 3-like [Asterias rubens]